MLLEKAFLTDLPLHLFDLKLDHRTERKRKKQIEVDDAPFSAYIYITNNIYLTNKEAEAVYYTVIKHNGHSASVFYISRVFSNVRSVLSQCNTRLHLLYDIEVMWRKTIKHAFSMFYTLIKHGFLTNQSA